jgi:hypothetical protein
MRARALVAVMQSGRMLTIAALLLSAAQSMAQPSAGGASKAPGGTPGQSAGGASKAPGGAGQQGHAGKAPSTGHWGGAYLGPGSTGQSPGGASRPPRKPSNKSR